MSTTIEWRDIPGWPRCRVSSSGTVRGPSGRALKSQTADSGHLYVWPIRGKKLFVHRAVLLAFVGPCPPGKESRHLDGIPSHNHLGNLLWGTRQEQRADERRHGTRCIGEKSGTAKLSESDVREIRELHGTVTLRELGRRYGVSHTAVRRAALGIKWGHIA